MKKIVWSLAALLLAAPAAAQVDDVWVTCNQYFAHFSFASGVEGLAAITFEDPAVAPEVSSLTVTAQEVTLPNPSLQSRLPADRFIPADFPVLISVLRGVDPGTAISFNGSYTVEITTDDLPSDTGMPFRLYKAPTGERFENATMTLGVGSHRVRGMSGAFSDFLIVADLRPRGEVVEDELRRFKTEVAAASGNGISAPVAATLDSEGDQVASAFESGDLDAAIAGVDAILETIDSETVQGNISSTFDADSESTSGNLVGFVRALRLSLVVADQLPELESAGITRSLVTAGGKEVEVRVSFDGATGVDVDEIVITAEDVDPLDPALLDRLPEFVSIPAGFPVLVTIEPGPDAEQAFRSDLDFELRTEDLSFFEGVNLRLFKAPDGGAFEDITRTVGLGSYRVRGHGAAFSEFLIVEDLRPEDSIISLKLGRLDVLLATHQGSIEGSVYSQLVAYRDSAKANSDQGLHGAAIDDLDQFIDLVESEAGRGIPDTWYLPDGRVNVAALLLSVAESLRFNLVLKRDPLAADPADVNRDGVVDVLDVFTVIDRVYGGS